MVGIRQRLGIRPAQRRLRYGPAGETILAMYRAGRFSAADVCEWMGSTSSSQPLARSVDTGLVKKHGKFQKHHKHTARNLLRKLDRQVDLLPPLYTARVPAWDAIAHKQITVDTSFLLIHEVLQTLVPEGEESEWCEAIDPSQSCFISRLHEWGRHLGVDTADGFWACISLWGDSAQYSKKAVDSILLLACRFLTGKMRFRLWVWAFAKRDLCACGCSGKCTVQEAFTVMSWSFRALLSGVYPHKDHTGDYFAADTWRGQMAGKPLRIKGACLAKTGDWAWLKQFVGLRGWLEGSSRQCCWVCGAKFEEGSFDDATLHAEWRGSLHTMSSFWQEMASENRFCSAVWSIPGLRLEWIRMDFMHMVDLGVTMYVNGNVLWHMYAALGGRRYADAADSKATCAKIMGMIRVACRDAKLDGPFIKLQLSRFRANHKPVLKIKAADSRRYIVLLCRVLELFFPANSPREQLVFACTNSLVKIYEELEASTLIPPSNPCSRSKGIFLSCDFLYKVFHHFFILLPLFAFSGRLNTFLFTMFLAVGCPKGLGSKFIAHGHQQACEAMCRCQQGTSCNCRRRLAVVCVR